jgi:hypothetical protein
LNTLIGDANSTENEMGYGFGDIITNSSARIIVIKLKGHSTIVVDSLELETALSRKQP